MADDLGGAFRQAGQCFPDVFRPIQAEHMVGGFQAGSAERFQIHFPQPIEDKIDLAAMPDKAFFAEADERDAVFLGQARDSFEVGGKKMDMMVGIDAVWSASEEGVEFFQLFLPA